MSGMPSPSRSPMAIAAPPAMPGSAACIAQRAVRARFEQPRAPAAGRNDLDVSVVEEIDDRDARNVGVGRRCNRIGIGPVALREEHIDLAAERSSSAMSMRPSRSMFTDRDGVEETAAGATVVRRFERAVAVSVEDGERRENQFAERRHRACRHRRHRRVRDSSGEAEIVIDMSGESPVADAEQDRDRVAVRVFGDDSGSPFMWISATATKVGMPPTG